MSQTLPAPSSLVLPPRAAPRPLTAGVPTAGGIHVPALDGLRGLAILMVLMDHLARIVTHGVAGSTAARFARCGWVGVDLFFVLSGFLITGILYDTLHARHYFRNFYMRRVLRIFPLYYGVVLGSVVVLPLIWNQAWFDSLLPHGGGRIGSSLAVLRHNQIWLWFYASGLTQSFHRLDWQMLGHFWSLDVEEQFYLVWPIVVFLVGRRKPLMVVCATVAVASTVLRAVLLRFASGTVDVYFFTPCRMDTLALGGLLALAVRGPQGVRPLLSPAKWSVVVCGILMMLWGWYRRALSHEDWWVQGPGFSVIALFFGGLLVLCLAGPADAGVARLFSRRELRLLGKYSYAMYVFHYLVMLVATPDGLAEMVGSYWLGATLYSLMVLALTLGLAFLSWHLYEKQFLKLKRFFPYERHPHSRPMPRAPRPIIKAA